MCDSFVYGVLSAGGMSGEKEAWCVLFTAGCPMPGTGPARDTCSLSPCGVKGARGRRGQRWGTPGGRVLRPRGAGEGQLEKVRCVTRVPCQRGPAGQSFSPADAKDTCGHWTHCSVTFAGEGSHCECPPRALLFPLPPPRTREVEDVISVSDPRKVRLGKVR